MGQVKNKKMKKENLQEKNKQTELSKDKKAEQKKKVDVKKNEGKKVKKKQNKKVVVKTFRKRKIHFDRFQLDTKKNNDIFSVGRIRVRGAKIRNYSFYSHSLDYDLVSDDEIVLENEFESEEKLSVGIIIVILFLCFGLGISVGYLLYRVAINNSAIIMVSSLLG